MILRCIIKVWPSGDKHWIPLQYEEGLFNKHGAKPVSVCPPNSPAVFLVTAEGFRKELRKDPPYYQLIPCPYCGVERDSNHIASEHMIDDPRGDGCKVTDPAM